MKIKRIVSASTWWQVELLLQNFGPIFTLCLKLQNIYQIWKHTYTWCNFDGADDREECDSLPRVRKSKNSLDCKILLAKTFRMARELRHADRVWLWACQQFFSQLVSLVSIGQPNLSTLVLVLLCSGPLANRLLVLFALGNIQTLWFWNYPQTLISRVILWKCINPRQPSHVTRNNTFWHACITLSG